MKVSIITICYNSIETIEDTLKSVLSQDYKDIEYIIVDGKSSDGTLEVIKKYSSQIAKIVSENDKGLYDALNKGISIATGDIIGFLHSDDLYYDTTVLSRVVRNFLNSDVDSVYGDLIYVKRNNPDKIVRYWESKPYSHGLFLKGWMPAHPTFFVKKSIYHSYGNFNLELKSAADYEIMLRFLHKHKISTTYLPQVLIKMRVGGKSNVSLSNRLKANREDRQAWKINGLKPSIFTLFRKPLSKIPQFYRKRKRK